MLKNLKNKDIDLSDLNIGIFLVCFVIFIISIVLVQNIFIIIVISFGLIFLNKKQNKIINFINNILPIILFSYLLLWFLNYNIININSILLVLIKLLLLINYLYLTLNYLRIKNDNIFNENRKLKKIYSFKQLRDNNLDRVKKYNQEEVDEFIKKNNINKESDYYKLIHDNFDRKCQNDLEEYVWINYLRFYKNKRFHKQKNLKIIDLVFFLIHVIILLIILIV